ncbi:MAG: hypothetical protein KF819_17185 [Labilithrix sp.]|nr:hypothetical protein [Labilithrix sp.]
MPAAFPRLFTFLALTTALGGSVFVVEGCSSDSVEAPASEAGEKREEEEAGDAGIDGRDGSTADVVERVDAQCPESKVVGMTGETCIGFGTGTPCGVPACGIPAYGYVCFNGGPPSFAGCLQLTQSSLGETYCCPELRCVTQPDQDGMCSATPATPHRAQCPPDGDGGNVAPPLGCVESGSGGSALERFYCCP